MDAFKNASFVGKGAKAKAQLTFFEVKIITKTFTSCLPLGLARLKLRSRLEVGESRLNGIYTDGIFWDCLDPLHWI